MEQHFRFIHCFRCCSSLHGVGNLIKWPQLNLIIPQLKSQSFRHSLSIKTNSIPTQSLEMPRSDLPMSRDQQLLSYLSLLRYGSDDPLHKGPRYLSYKAISHLTGVKAGTIFHLLKQYREPASKQLPLFHRKRLRLRKHHIDYLLNEDTLKSWAHLSLKQRAKFFHRKFPELKVSSSSI